MVALCSFNTVRWSLRATTVACCCYDSAGRLQIITVGARLLLVAREAASWNV